MDLDKANDAAAEIVSSGHKLSRIEAWRALTGPADYQVDELLSEEDFVNNGMRETWYFDHAWDELDSGVEFLLGMSVTYEQQGALEGVSISIRAYMPPGMPANEIAAIEAQGFFTARGNSGWVIGLQSPATISESDFVLLVESVASTGVELVSEWELSLAGIGGDSPKQDFEIHQNPLDIQFDLAVATFQAGQEKKALKMLKALAKKGHSLSIWELFNRAISEGDMRGARSLCKFERESAQSAMLRAVLTEAETGIDAELYVKAFKLGHAGAAIHLSKYFAEIGDFKQAKGWASKAEALGEIDDQTMSEHWARLLELGIEI